MLSTGYIRYERYSRDLRVDMKLNVNIFFSFGKKTESALVIPVWTFPFHLFIRETCNILPDRETTKHDKNKSTKPLKIWDLLPT